MGTEILTEGWKLSYDVFKHITTLDTAALLILIGLLEKLFKEPKWRPLVGCAIVLFLASIVGCLVMMYVISFLVAIGDKPNGFPNVLATVFFILAIGGFFVGLCCLGAFTIKNFYRTVLPTEERLKSEPLQ
jgi:hypothetical protein